MKNAKKTAALITAFALLFQLLPAPISAVAENAEDKPTFVGGAFDKAWEVRHYSNFDQKGVTLDDTLVDRANCGWGCHETYVGGQGRYFALDPNSSAANAGNHVLKLTRTKTHTKSEMTYISLKAGDITNTYPPEPEHDGLTGKVSLGMRVYCRELNETPFKILITDSRVRWTWSQGNTIAEVLIQKSTEGAVLSVNNTQIGTCPVGEWFDLQLDFDTSALTLNVLKNGTKLNDAPVTLTASGTDFRRDIGFVGLDIVQDESKNCTGTVYVDDVCAWTDKSADVSAALAALTESTFTEESTAAITTNLTLPATVPGYDKAKIVWKSSNTKVISDGGVVIPAETAQKVTLTAQITFEADYSVVQNASAERTFDLTVSPWRDPPTVTAEPTFVGGAFGETWAVRHYSDFEKTDGITLDETPVDSANYGWDSHESYVGQLERFFVLDPYDYSGTGFENANRALKLKRTGVHYQNGDTSKAPMSETTYVSLKEGPILETASPAPTEDGLTGKVSLGMRLRYEELNEMPFKIWVTDSYVRYSWHQGNTIAEILVKENGSSLDLTVNGSSVGTCPKDDWFTLQLDFDTDALSFDIYKDGVKLNKTPIDFKTKSGANFRADIGWLGYHIEQDAAKNSLGTMYIDDVCAWTDETAALNAAAAQLTLSDLTDESPTAITKELALPQTVGENAVEWTSDNAAINAQSGAVTRGITTKAVTLTAKIFAPENACDIKRAYVTKTFTLEVLPQEGITDEQIVQDVADNFLTDERVSTQPLNSVTRILRTLPTTGPDGAQISWNAGGSAYVTDDGLVTRPKTEDGDHTMTLTATVTKGSAVKTKGFSITVLAEPNGAALCAEVKGWLTLAHLTEDPASSIKHKLYLINEADGVKITYSSSNPAAIDENGNVYRTAEKQYATYTVHYFYQDKELDSEEFELTIAKSAEISVEEDLAAITLDESTPVTDNLYLPTKGAHNGLAINWTSSNTDVILVVASTQTGMVTRPDNIADDPAQGGDKVVTLTATIKSETKQKSRKFVLTVAQMKKNADLVQEAADALVWSNISMESKDNVTRNLALTKSFSTGVSVEWSFSPEGIVDDDGFVNNPEAPLPAVNVTINAVASRGNESKAANPIEITVQPLSGDDILAKAKAALTFSVISDEPINSVTKNLSLVNTWKDTAVSWSCADDTIKLGAAGGAPVGLVSRPAYGSGVKNTTLTATLTRGGKSVRKSFMITVLQEETYTELYREAYESSALTLGGSPMYDDGGTWSSVPNTTPVTVKLDPTDPANRTMNFMKRKGEKNPWDTTSITRSLLYYFPSVGAGRLTFGARFYMPDNAEENFYDDYFTFEIMSPGGSQIPINICGDGRLSFSVNEQGVAKTLYTKAPVFERNKWNSFTVEADTASMRFNMYVNGALVTADGDITYKDKAYSTWNGIAFTKAETTTDPSLSGIRLSMIYNASDKGDSNIYFDDLHLLQKNELSSSAINAYNAFEKEFLSQNNLGALDKNLVFPESQGAASFSYASSDETALTADGTINQGAAEKTLTFTVQMTLSSDTVEKSYDVTVLAITPALAVEKDLADAVAQVKGAYNLTALTEDISFAQTGARGSTITGAAVGGDTAAIDAQGKISRADTDRTVSYQITATNGGEQKSETLTLVIKARQTADAGGLQSGGGGSSSAAANVVYGAGVNNKPQFSGNDSTAPAEKSSFADVSENHWAYAALSALRDRGIMQGSGQNNAEPERGVTRAEFAKLIVAALNLKPQGTGIGFYDVAQTHWCYQYIRTLSSNDIVHGKADGTFDTEGLITREDMAVMLYRAAECVGTTLINERESAFSDGDSIADYAQSAVNALYAAGILNGTDGNRFAPTDNATRAEAAQLIYVYLQKMS